MAGVGGVGMGVGPMVGGAWVSKERICEEAGSGAGSSGACLGGPRRTRSELLAESGCLWDPGLGDTCEGSRHLAGC